MLWDKKNKKGVPIPLILLGGVVILGLIIWGIVDRKSVV